MNHADISRLPCCRATRPVEMWFLKRCMQLQYLWEWCASLLWWRISSGAETLRRDRRWRRPLNWPSPLSISRWIAAVLWGSKVKAKLESFSHLSRFWDCVLLAPLTTSSPLFPLAFPTWKPGTNHGEPIRQISTTYIKFAKVEWQRCMSANAIDIEHFSKVVGRWRWYVGQRVHIKWFGTFIHLHKCNRLGHVPNYFYTLWSFATGRSHGHWHCHILKF